MTTGVSFPSFAVDIAWTMTSGAADAAFPVSNLADLKEIVRPWRASAPGAREFLGVLPASQFVQFIALCRHNGPAGATYRIRLYSDAAATALVYDSTALALGAAGLFSRTTPHLLAVAIAVRAVRINLSSMGTAWQVGGVEVAGFFDLSDATARSLGLKAQDSVKPIGEGAIQGTRQFSPRAITCGLDVIDWTTDGETFQDFAWATGTDQPFVWVRDYDDATSWARECALVRNSTLQGLTKNAWVLGALSIQAQEHL